MNDGLERKQREAVVILLANYAYKSLDSSRLRALCQKNEGSVDTKQRPTKMGGRITYWTLPP
jgi:hypothetical protein